MWGFDLILERCTEHCLLANFHDSMCSAELAFHIFSSSLSFSISSLDAPSGSGGTRLCREKRNIFSSVGQQFQNNLKEFKNLNKYFKHYSLRSNHCIILMAGQDKNLQKCELVASHYYLLIIQVNI